MRTGLYLVIAETGLVTAVLVYAARTHRPAPGQNGFSLQAFGLLLLAGGVLAIYTLVLLIPLAAARHRLSAVALKLISLPFLLIPPAFIDLIGSTPGPTLVLCGIQILYLVIIWP